MGAFGDCEVAVVAVVEVAGVDADEDLGGLEPGAGGAHTY